MEITMDQWADDYWKSCSIEERVEMCQQHGDSIFAARHDYAPEYAGRAIRES